MQLCCRQKKPTHVVQIQLSWVRGVFGGSGVPAAFNLQLQLNCVYFRSFLLCRLLTWNRQSRSHIAHTHTCLEDIWHLSPPLPPYTYDLLCAVNVLCCDRQFWNDLEWNCYFHISCCLAQFQVRATAHQHHQHYTDNKNGFPLWLYSGLKGICIWSAELLSNDDSTKHCQTPGFYTAQYNGSSADCWH